VVAADAIDPAAAKRAATASASSCVGKLAAKDRLDTPDSQGCLTSHEVSVASGYSGDVGVMDSYFDIQMGRWIDPGRDDKRHEILTEGQAGDRAAAITLRPRTSRTEIRVPPWLRIGMVAWLSRSTEVSRSHRRRGWTRELTCSNKLPNARQ